MAASTFDGDMTGSMLVDPSVFDTPWPFFDRLRAEAPAWLVPDSSIVVVSSFAALHEAVGRPEDFSSHLTALLYRRDDGHPATVAFGDGSTNVLATADPPVHSVHRSMMLPELAARRMGELRPFVDQLSIAMLDRALDSPSVEFMASVANAVPIRLVSRLIGWEGEDPDALLAAAFDSTAILGASGTRAEIEAAMERTAAVGGWIAEQAVAALASPPADGLLGAVARAVNDQQIELTDAITSCTRCSARAVNPPPV